MNGLCKIQKGRLVPTLEAKEVETSPVSRFVYPQLKVAQIYAFDALLHEEGTKEIMLASISQA